MVELLLPFEAERKRLARQALKILDRLMDAPATNVQLCQIALKYNARISELRQAGYNIECYDHDRVTGIAWYRLVL